MFKISSFVEKERWKGMRRANAPTVLPMPPGGRVLQRREVNSTVAEFRIPNNVPNSRELLI